MHQQLMTLPHLLLGSHSGVWPPEDMRYQSPHDQVDQVDRVIDPIKANLVMIVVLVVQVMLVVHIQVSIVVIQHRNVDDGESWFQ